MVRENRRHNNWLVLKIRFKNAVEINEIRVELK